MLTVCHCYAAANEVLNLRLGAQLPVFTANTAREHRCHFSRPCLRAVSTAVFKDIGSREPATRVYKMTSVLYTRIHGP